MKSPAHVKLTLLRCALALLVLSCDSTHPVDDPASEMTSPGTVVLVSIDTWRRDATGFLGGLDPSPTPFLDQLAKRGLVAVDAMAPVPLTGPSHWSMLSGRWPWRDGVRVNGDRPTRSQGFPNLPEILQEQGWNTAGFVSSAVVSQRTGFASGFDHFDAQFHQPGGISDLQMASRRGDATLRTALSWLDEQEPGAKIFLWIHLFDPHLPYASPPGIFRGEHAAYYAEVAFADQQLAILSQRLAELGRPLEESLWVVLSDHGEGLGAHDEDTHGLLLHGATTRIPMLVAGKSVQRGRFETLSSTVDVLPTILGALGLDVAPRDGIDLLHDVGQADRPIPLESLMGAQAWGLAPVVGLRQRQWLWESSPADHLWDVNADPREEHDVAASRVDEVEKLKRVRQDIGIPDTNSIQEHDRETVAQLRALGYVEAASKAGTADVREFSAKGAKWIKGITINLSNKNYAQAEFYVKKALEHYPDSMEIWNHAGFVALGLRDPAEAERRFRRAVALNPDHVSARINLANVLLQANRLDEAEIEYQNVLHNEPTDLMALYNLGMLLARQDRIEEGAVFWRKFYELAPTHPNAAPVKRKLIEWGQETHSND